jgi:hypothetical protein
MLGEPNWELKKEHVGGTQLGTSKEHVGGTQLGTSKEHVGPRDLLPLVIGAFDISILFRFFARSFIKPSGMVKRSWNELN